MTAVHCVSLCVVLLVVFLLSSSVHSQPSNPPLPSANGDPMFIGFLGQSFQVHGIAHQIYSIVSDAQTQINAEFVFLPSGECPPATIVKSACWSHPGSYLGRMSIQTATTRILIEPGNATTGFTAVKINDEQLTIGDKIEIPLVKSITTTTTGKDLKNSLEYVSSHVIIVDVGLYSITIHNSDKFVNLHTIAVKDWKRLTSTVQPHGILGQTWHILGKEVKQEVAGLEGFIEDYAEQANDLWGTKTLHNKFTS